MSVQFQASTKSKKDKLDFIKDNFSKVAAKDGEVELLKLGGNEAVYKSGGFTQFGHLDKTKKGSDIFIPDKDISNLGDDKLDEVYSAVMEKSKGQDGENPFLPHFDDDPAEDAEELIEPFSIFKP